MNSIVSLYDLIDIYNTELNIKKGIIKETFRLYTDICKDNIKKGIPIIIPNVCTLENNYMESTMYVTNSYIAQEISSVTNIPYMTVNTIIKKLMQDIQDILVNKQQEFLFREVCKLKPIIKEDDSITVYVSTSSSLKDTDKSIRPHTCKWLKKANKKSIEV